jgi:transcriptional regulator with XRE-family HTH domain
VSAERELPFGVLLRRWRTNRRMTQADLAAVANSSTRHLSYLETGRSQPSRDMIMRLAEHLEVPLREQNTLLLAAGFAPTFRERPFAELAAARAAMERVIDAHLPYPAFAVDRRWNVILSNRALPQLYEGCSADLLRPPVNAVRLILHPRGMGPRILNFSEWRGHTIALLRRQIETRPDPQIQALLSEVMAYPAPGAGNPADGADDSRRYAMPLKIATRLGTASFLSTTTIFGTPTDVTLSELALEMLFPADDETIAVVNRMVAESTAQPSREALEETASR